MRFKVILWMLVALLPGLTAALRPTYFISTPNVIRVGVDETVVINIFGEINTGAGGVPVTVELQDYPARTNTYSTQTVNVIKNIPTTVSLQVSPQDFVARNNPDEPQYVYLHASSQSAAIAFNDGTKVLLSYKAGYTFIQTDKPIYTPNQKGDLTANKVVVCPNVHIRLVCVNQQMRPSEDQVQVDILTPQGVIVKRFADVQPEAGFVMVDYTFPPAPAFGNWTVVAYYGHEKQHKTSVQFFVKEYVLPTYSVEVTVQPTAYLISSYQRITTLVHAKYVFGENVQQGYYRIKYSLLDTDGSLELIKDVNNNLTLSEHGQGVNVLQMAEILRGQDFDDFIGKSLHIEAFVVEAATGKVESTNNTVLEFVNSPFRFKWDQTLKYFKTNLPFEVKSDVVYCYGDPIPNLNVRVSAVGHMVGGGQNILQSEEELQMTNLHGQVEFTLNVPLNTQRIVVTMTTVAGGELANFEKRDTFEIQQFNSRGNNQLLIRHAHDIVWVSESIAIDLQINGENLENVDVIFTYIVAGGKILQAQGIEEVIANTVTDIRITQEMVPSARMVAFYVNDANQVVADAIWIDVEDQCENPVEVSVPANTNGRNYYMPGDTVALTLTGKQQTKVALLAVDSAVYLLQDYHRLNKKKVFARMASYDLGCGPGGGRDTQDIFKNAGISVITNAALQTEGREDLSCDEHNRRRRSIQGADYNLAELQAKYAGNDTLTGYCTKGARIVTGFSCLERRNRLTDPSRPSWKGFDEDHPNMVAFYQCCLAISQAEGRSGGVPNLPPPKVDFGDVQIRSDFRESWLIKDPLVNFGDTESVEHPIALPHSITTWIIQAVGVSPLHGMCVADNQEIVTRREFFLDVAVPYSVMRHEQVSIVATVYNYDENDNDISRVNLQMAGLDGLCSNARPGEFVIQEGEVPAGKSKSFSFIVIPLEVKDFKVTIYMFSSSGNDAVRKTLHVVPEGQPQVLPLSIILDPAGIGQQLPPNELRQIIDHGQNHNLEHQQQMDQPNRHQTDTVRLVMPADAVPNTVKCEVSMIGSLLGPVANIVVEGLNVGSFFPLPTGCGEQTMVKMAPNVYIFKYLKSIGQATAEYEQKAISNIEYGYSHEVNHYWRNGAFSNPGLTAFVLRVFCYARDVAFIDEAVVCTSMTYLAGKQNADGSFGSSRRGTVDTPAEFAAYVLIALSECTCRTVDTTETISRATIYLEGKFDEIRQDVQSMAIVTYALALVNSERANDRFNPQLKLLATENAAQGTKYFGTQPSGPLTVETTAYALLAQVQLREISYSYPLVLWLVTQRDQIGNWRSTQDTMVALQALTEYTKQAHHGDIDLSCDVSASVDAQFQQHWDVRTANALVLQSTQQEAPVEGDLIFDTNGAGIATLSVNLHYYKATGDQDLCPFDMTVTPRDEKAAAPLPGNNVNEKPKKKISITVCARYLGEGKTNDAIIDVGLLSGFSPITDTLKKVTEDMEEVQNFEVSDRSVVFYIDEVPATEPLCLKFEAQQDFEVGNVQPVPVKVYDYYLPDIKCTKFYRPDGGSPILDTICHGGACECAAARCLNMNSKVKSDPLALKNMACQSAEHFAYKTTFVEKLRKDTFDVFKLEVTPLKKGSDQDVQMGQHRQFWKSANCEQPNLVVGNEYLIVGKGGLALKDDSGAVLEYRHFVDSEFTVIYWPRNQTQYRALETACKNACPLNGNNRNCKIACREGHRPAEKALLKYFENVEREFMGGCPQ